MTGRMHITAAGMVTPVGLDCKSSCAAMRARLDGFAETKFVSGGEWLLGAAIELPRPWTGVTKLACSASAAISEILWSTPSAATDLDIILCLSEPDRMGRPITDPQSFSRTLLHNADLPATTNIRLVEHGRPSGLVALTYAEKALMKGRAKHVIIVGVDSYLTTGSITKYVGASRLLTPDNANGFIPGEAASAILCSLSEGGLRFCGVGLAREDAFIYNGNDEDGLDVPLRADGMTAAYKAALTSARTSMDEIDYRISDLIGETYYFKQSALAAQRLLRERPDIQDIWSPAENIGNIGAAAVPTMVAMALTAGQKGYAYGDPVLIDASADDGSCGAAVFQTRVDAMARAA